MAVNKGGTPAEFWIERRFWRGVKFGIEVAGVLSVALIVVQLILTGVSERTARAFDMVTRFNGDDMRAARTVLEDVSRAYNDALKGADGYSPEQMAVIGEAEVFGDGPRAGTTRAALVTVTEFLDEVAVCVEAGLCLQKSACQYFTNYAGDLTHVFGSAIRRYGTENGLERFGRGVERLAGYRCKPLF